MFEKIKELDMEAMGKRIRSAREERGFAREKLAELIDVSPQFIADVEYGKKGVSIKTLFSLKQVLEVTADYILTGRVYDADKDAEAMKVCDEIMETLKTYNLEGLKNFRKISRLYADNVPRKEEK